MEFFFFLAENKNHLLHTYLSLIKNHLENYAAKLAIPILRVQSGHRRIQLEGISNRKIKKISKIVWTASKASSTPALLTTLQRSTRINGVYAGIYMHNNNKRLLKNFYVPMFAYLEIIGYMYVSIIVYFIECFYSIILTHHVTFQNVEFNIIFIRQNSYDYFIITYFKF